ncbi:hypothetical protein O9929_28205 [Vibrio lentus]|nr:hypothetical protein [Vibrio lentus]
MRFEQDLRTSLNEGAASDAENAELVLSQKIAHLITLTCAAGRRERGFSDGGELSTELEKAKEENLRVCVFIPPARVLSSIY